MNRIRIFLKILYDLLEIICLIFNKSPLDSNEICIKIIVPSTNYGLDLNFLQLSLCNKLRNSIFMRFEWSSNWAYAPGWMRLMNGMIPLQR